MEYMQHTHLKGNSNSETMRTILLLGLLVASATTHAQNTYGDIIGTLKDPHTNEGVFGATVYTSQGDAVYRQITDPDGRFRISAVPPGTYDIMFIYMGDTVKSPEPADVAPDGFGDIGTVYFATATDKADSNKVITLDGGVVIGSGLQLKKGVTPEIKLTAKEIKLSPSKFDIKGLVAGMTSDVRQTDDGSLVFRGARKGDLIYYIDGIKMGETQNVPSVAMGYVMVYSGAIPAKYGDTNGGVIVVETRGYFDLLREYNSRMSLGGH